MRIASAKRAVVNYANHPLHRNEPIAPFFIVGAGRSGSTLLRRILLAHPVLHIPPETHVLGDAIHLYRRHRHWPWSQLVRLVLAQFEFQRDFEAFELQLRPLVEGLERAPHDDRSCALILDRLYARHASESSSEAPRWGDKSPFNSFHLKPIAAVFPRAVFIHVVRDGCDVVSSLLDAELFVDVWGAGRRWAQSIAAVDEFERTHADRVHEVRYEELVSEPVRVVENLCRFLTVERAPGMVDSEGLAERMGDVPRHAHHQRVREPISTSSIGEGRRKLSASDRHSLAPLIDPTLQRLGYPPC